ncbi:Uncharacterized protein dnl_32950 [Desulfonema limicola]|uniref:Uncharacterized protein n=1 Tax=Desulfonema limicola TaxID=45656 RepID=A0A975B8V4_9BACT|nr:hypothetical protein [Desulfonema limicola]QTA80977.1 Uncharacterized protein dnl_32950 [Desulfonema limicola]
MKNIFLKTICCFTFFLIHAVAVSASDVDVLACPEGCLTLQMDMYLSSEISKHGVLK